MSAVDTLAMVTVGASCWGATLGVEAGLTLALVGDNICLRGGWEAGFSCAK